MKNRIQSFEGVEQIPQGLAGGFFIYSSGREETLLFADANVIRIFGCGTFGELYEYVGGSFRGMVYPEDLHKIENEIQAQTMFGEKRHDYVRYRIRTKNGEIRYLEDFGHLLHRSDGESFFYVFVVDVDRNEYVNPSLNSFAEAQVLSMKQEVDSLTGLFNMAYFYQKVQGLVSSPGGRRESLSLIHFDIPNFKLFNERNGFKMGDEVLCDAARVIRGEFPDGTAARFSDDHFVVCSPGSSDDIIARVERVYRAMLLAEEPNKRVRIKAGIYYLSDRYEEVGLACDHARLACNSIKRRHDVNYCVYDEMLRERLRRQQYVIDHIDEAIEKEYLKVYYQPIVRLGTGEICGYEALVRWVDERYGMFSPGDFIETLEKFHLIHVVDAYVIRKVAEDYRRLRDAGEPVVPVSVNLSRLDFELTDVFALVEAITAQYDMPRNMLELEITESALNDIEGYIRSELEKLRAAGYPIWLDDFGSGYSSLNTLAQYDFDVLKMDLVFLRSLDSNPRTAGLLNIIVQGARGLGFETLAEGVETERQISFLKQIGCVRAQGFYYSKPLPMEESRLVTSAKGLKWEARS